VAVIGRKWFLAAHQGKNRWMDKRDCPQPGRGLPAEVEPPPEQNEEWSNLPWGAPDDELDHVLVSHDGES
jgi:hypothetical protein